MSLLTPHGKGFSFLDAFEVIEPGKQGRGSKWLDPQSPFFADHFPGQPLMPAVLLIECAAQCAGALLAATQGPGAPVHFVLAQVLQFKVTRSVLPDERIESEVTLQASFGNLAQFEAVLRVNQLEVARGRLVLGTGQA